MQEVTHRKTLDKLTNQPRVRPSAPVLDYEPLSQKDREKALDDGSFKRPTFGGLGQASLFPERQTKTPTLIEARNNSIGPGKTRH